MPEHDTTVNSLIRDLLQDYLSRGSRMRLAARKLLHIADQGPYFDTGPGSIRRAELHERR